MKKNDETVIGFELPELSPDDRALFAMLPSDGRAESHHSLRQALGWDDLRFWKARDSLIEKGYITSAQGKGGNYYRRLPTQPSEEEVITEAGEVAAPVDDTPVSHSGIELPDLFVSGIEKWAMESQLGDYFLEALRPNDDPSLVARFGKRPDVILVNVETFQYVPNKHMEVVSFDVKRSDSWTLGSVYEAAGHLRFSNRSFLALQKDPRTGPPVGLQPRIEDECRRLGLGLILFEDPADYSTFSFKLSPLSTPCAAREMERLLETASSENRGRIVRWLR